RLLRSPTFQTPARLRAEHHESEGMTRTSAFRARAWRSLLPKLPAPLHYRRDGPDRPGLGQVGSFYLRLRLRQVCGIDPPRHQRDYSGSAVAAVACHSQRVNADSHVRFADVLPAASGHRTHTSNHTSPPAKRRLRLSASA